MGDELKSDQSDFEWPEDIESERLHENEEIREIREDFWFSSEDESLGKTENRRKSQKIVVSIESIISQILLDLAEERLPSMRLSSK